MSGALRVTVDVEEIVVVVIVVLAGSDEVVVVELDVASLLPLRGMGTSSPFESR